MSEKREQSSSSLVVSNRTATGEGLCRMARPRGRHCGLAQTMPVAPREFSSEHGTGLAKSVLLQTQAWGSCHALGIIRGPPTSALFSLPCSVFQLCLPHREMSCFRPCLPRPCGTSGPSPLASSCNEPCIARCADSTVAIQASPVVVTLPGPILTSFPQSTAVGSSLSAAVGSSLSAGGVPITSGGSLDLGAVGLCLPPPRCSLNC